MSLLTTPSHLPFPAMASRDRGRPLLARHAFSCLAAPALSKRDLAWFGAARGKLPLFGNPRLLALGISGLLRFAQSLRSLLLPSPLSGLIFLPGEKASARVPSKWPPHKPRRGHSVCGTPTAGLRENFHAAIFPVGGFTPRFCFASTRSRRAICRDEALRSACGGNPDIDQTSTNDRGPAACMGRVEIPQRSNLRPR